MRNEQTKKATIEAIDSMIRNADKGPSGFWTEDRKGCGNPAIFPEFEDGLKHGRLVSIEHFLCPWNTAVVYGAGHGDLNTGCLHSCSFDKAKYLSGQELAEVLARFKTRLENGDYDQPGQLSPLLTETELGHIEERILAERRERDRLEERKRQERLEKAADLIAKYPDKEYLLATYYGEKDFVTEDGGLIFFDPDSRKDTAGAENMSYDEYLDVQFASLGHEYRSGFACGLFNCLFPFKGQIQKINDLYICFDRIFITGMYPDGEMYDGKEEHVWMDKAGFEGFRVGDSVSFGAEIYRYIKTGNGKRIDYGLRNPYEIQKIDAYTLPTDDELTRQCVRDIVCESCSLNEYCNRINCTMNPRERSILERQMFNAVKAGTNKET